jgi:hypothetical protein
MSTNDRLTTLFESMGIQNRILSGEEDLSSFDFNKTYHQFGIQWLAVCLVLLKLNIDYRNDRPFLKNLYNISCINDYNTISNKDEKQISDIILNAIITAVNISAGNRYAELSGTRIKTIGNYVDKF